jgi:molybdate transport system substrate-binding protein
VVKCLRIAKNDRKRRFIKQLKLQNPSAQGGLKHLTAPQWRKSPVFQKPAKSNLIQVNRTILKQFFMPILPKTCENMSRHGKIANRPESCVRPVPGKRQPMAGLDGLSTGRARCIAMKITTILKVLPALAAVWAGVALHAATIAVFAAASLTDGLGEIAHDYQSKTGDKIEFNFAASSLLARQIEEGAPADIFFSADEAKMDALEKKGLIDKNTRRSRLSNSLVIVQAADSPLSIHSPEDLTMDKIGHVALADPQSVPAGIYAREYLGKIHLWEKIAPKVVPMANVRAALAAVESGDAEAGIVYKTDAAISKKVQVAFAVPPRDGPKISYPMAVTTEARDPKAARAFLEYLDSDEAGRVFAKFGFIVDNHAP